MSYTPPAANAVNFALVPLTPPAANAVNFELASSAGVTATLAATLQAATLASTATVTPAGAAITATLAATLQDATLSATATVPTVPVPETTFLAGGGGSAKSWWKKKEEVEALQAAIRRAMYGEPAETVIETIAEVRRVIRPAPAPLDLPPAEDYSSELAHFEAITKALDLVAREASRRKAIADRKSHDELMSRRKARAAKVSKILRLLDMIEAA